MGVRRVVVRLALDMAWNLIRSDNFGDALQYPPRLELSQALWRVSDTVHNLTFISFLGMLCLLSNARSKWSLVVYVEAQERPTEDPVASHKQTMLLHRLLMVGRCQVVIKEDRQTNL
eukprot:SAG31_NODE_116_length_24094_cov_38.884184_14_plen_117_part_00